MAAMLSLVAMTVSVRANQAPDTSLAQAPSAAQIVEAMLQRPERELDLAVAKLEVDSLIDPTIDVSAALAQVDGMVEAIKRMAGPSSSNRQKLSALREYLYVSGNWNGNRPYGYDMDDPLGTKIANKLLSHYLSRRRGNCVTMPILFIILGQRLNLPVTLAVAPLHVFVKYTEEGTGESFNIETTSGAHVARDAWYREKMPMTDAAVANGVYLAPLSRREAVALMADTLIEHHVTTKQYDEAIAIADLVLAAYPKFAQAMVGRGTAAARLLEERFYQRYSTPDVIPVARRDEYAQLVEINRTSFDQAEALGWRPVE